MKRHVAVSSFVVSSLCLAISGPVFAGQGGAVVDQAVQNIQADMDHPRPNGPQASEEVFERCKKVISGHVERCAKVNKWVCGKCVKKIKRLLEVGDARQARQISRRCVCLINSKTDRRIRVIRRHCDECVRFLVRLETPRLAQQVKAFCKDAVERVNASRG